MGALQGKDIYPRICGGVYLNYLDCRGMLGGHWQDDHDWAPRQTIVSVLVLVAGVIRIRCLFEYNSTMLTKSTRVEKETCHSSIYLRHKCTWQADEVC
jgi:hypothetical protein